MKPLTITTAAIALLTATTAVANHHGEMKHEKPAGMAEIDLNNDGRIDFTEFSNHFEKKHGWSAAESAEEFVRLAGDSGTMDETALAMVRMGDRMKSDGMKKSMSEKKMSDTSMDDRMMDRSGTSRTMTATTTNMGSMKTMNPMMTSDYGRFSDYDSNNDGRVTFAEYSKYRKKSNVSMTAAAQEFMRVSNGQRNFDEARFNTSVSTGVIMRPAYSMRTMTRTDMNGM